MSSAHPEIARAAVDRLPYEIAKHRILPTEQACAFVGISVAHWRRLRVKGGCPAPVKIGVRKEGWRIGDLVEWQESRTKREPAQSEQV